MDTAHILVGHQPAYLPWPGYFSRLLDVRRFILLDHVAFSARGWQQRNYVRGPDDQPRLLTVPIRHCHGQPIQQARIADDRWRHRHWRLITQQYRRAPFWPQWEPRLAAIYARPWQRLAPLNEALTRLLLDGFSIDVELVPSSSLAPQGRKTQMLIELCRLTGTSTLRVGVGAIGYLDVAALGHAGVGVEIATYHPIPYDQGQRRPWLPGLSALDLLVHAGPRARRNLAAGAGIWPWRPAKAVVA